MALPRTRSGNENLACDVSVALPEGHFAGKERIAWRRLHVAVAVECPGRHHMLAGGGHSPAERPESPRQAAPVPVVGHRPEHPRRQPRSVVDSDFHRRDRRTPGGAKDDVLAASTHNFCWG